MSGGTALAALPHYSDIVDLVTDDPFLVDIIAPIESEALGEAVAAGERAGAAAALSVFDEVVQRQANLADLLDRAEARSNLGLGDAAVLSRSTKEQAQKGESDEVALTPLRGKDLLTALLGAISVNALGNATRAVEEWLARTTTIDMPRAAIASAKIPLTAFVVTGFAAIGDGGGGATYVRGSSTGPMAIRDAAGTWWNLATNVPRLNVRWFGATGDGATDDSAAIKAALGSNRTVVCPTPGNYLIAQPVGGGGISDMTFVIQAGATLTKASTLANKMFQFDNANRIRFTSEGGYGKIDVSQAPNSGAGQANDALYFAGASGSHDIEVDHIYFDGGPDHLTAGGDSFVFIAGNNPRVHHNKFRAAKDLAIYLTGLGSGDVSVGNGDVYANIFINCGGCGSAKRLFQGCDWHDNLVFGGLHGFFSGEADVSNMPGVRNRYRNNYFEGLSGNAIISRMSFGDIISGNVGRNHAGGEFISIQGSVGWKSLNNRLTIDPAVFVSPSTQCGMRVQNRTFNGTTYQSTGGSAVGDTYEGVYRPIREMDALQDGNTYENITRTGHTVDITLAGPNSIQRTTSIITGGAVTRIAPGTGQLTIAAGTGGGTPLIFEAGGVEQLRASGGTVSVGKADVGFVNPGHNLQADGTARHIGSGRTPLQVGRTTSDGDVALFYRDATPILQFFLSATGGPAIIARQTDHHLTLSATGLGRAVLTSPLRHKSYTVATLPTTGLSAGDEAYCSNARVLGANGVQEAAGSGTGGLVSYGPNGWRVAGTNLVAAA